jgi:hypothetical protein
MNVHMSDSGQLADLHLALLLHGVYTTPRGMINLSTALSPGDLDDITAAYSTAFTLVRGHGIGLTGAGRAGGAWGGRDERAWVGSGRRRGLRRP